MKTFINLVMIVKIKFTCHNAPNWCIHPISVLLEEMLRWLRDNLLTGDQNLFLQENTVRPGILVMINDTDWDLMVSAVQTLLIHLFENINMWLFFSIKFPQGETEYILQPGDHILFISTLHGG